MKLRFLPIIPMLLIVIFMMYSIFIPYSDPSALVTNEVMFNALGKGFVPILKFCSYLGGLRGVAVIIVSTIAGYFLGNKLPLKLSQEEGYRQ